MADAAPGAPDAAVTAHLVARRARLLGPAYRLFYDEPFHPVRGDGVWLYDAAGTPWLDAYNNVVCVGHAHPRVVEAIARQAAVLNTHTRYLHDGILDYAERLLATMPAALGHATFTCTGSEANDLALRIAGAHTGGTGLVVTRWAYHGVTSALACASPSLGAHVRLGDHVRLVDAPSGGDADTGRRFAEGVRAAIADLRAHGLKPAALMVDTVFSSDGVFTGPAGFLAEAVAAIREAGGVFIADEVQPGFGRTGEAFWGFQRHGVVPDIATLGKPMGNGHPVAGLAVRPDVMRAFGQASRYFNTFGGNPVSMAAAAAVLDVIEDERLQCNALAVGNYLRERLAALAERHALVGEVRGAGLFVAVELVSDRATRAPATAQAARVVNALRRRQVLLSATGPHAHVLKIRPPLVFRREHADLLVQRLDDVLGELDRGDAPARASGRTAG
ncbi:MAG TPA: aminotransferase class III-fold pyridoxal phosphate-dependent enzyme [Variovorax sp.]|nr:aminotransferase class III-fold pyridoxal phosphate-dependent enzyme [Variovorax sp.]